MARFRLSRAAEADLKKLLHFSAEYWGDEARARYAGLIRIAMQQIASDPKGRGTRDRNELSQGLRSFHLRHTRIDDDPLIAVGRPVHVLFYRAEGAGLIEIVRVLHERMQPTEYLEPGC